MTDPKTAGMGKRMSVARTNIICPNCGKAEAINCGFGFEWSIQNMMCRCPWTAKRRKITEPTAKRGRKP